MTDASWTAFFELHRDLPREGPGTPEDVAWAAAIAGLSGTARICDAACGPGADIAALRQAAPGGHVTALDKYPHFVAQAKALHGADPAVDVQVGDMAEIRGPFELIWCAGALYFLGITEGLKTWRAALTPGGVVAFSEPCWFTDDRPQAAEYTTLATRKLSAAAWENYYGPMDKRIALLSPGDTPELRRVRAEARREADGWRAHQDSFGYLLSVVRPDGV